MAKSSPDTLIDAHVSVSQCKLAIDALRTHELKKEEKQQGLELLPGKEEVVWLVLATKQVHPEKKLTPFKMCVI
jgi:ribosome biogenesis protein UTP30